MLKQKVAVLVSGGGTNLQALIDAEKAGIIKSGKISLVIADKPGAYALERAKNHQIKAEVVDKKTAKSPDDFEGQILEILKNEKIDIIVLAGFLNILSAKFIGHYPKRILNIHPSLIPSFCGDGYYGLRVHEAAMAYGVKVTGATVHFVNEIVDGGEILRQKAVEIYKDDTPQSLQKRVMEEAEWQILPLALEDVCAYYSNL